MNYIKSFAIFFLITLYSATTMSSTIEIIKNATIDKLLCNEKDEAYVSYIINDFPVKIQEKNNYFEIKVIQYS